MRIRFAFSCLLGATVLICSSAPVIKTNSRVASPVKPAPTKFARPSSLVVSRAVENEPFGAIHAPPAEASPQAASTEDFNIAKMPTTLERARAALAESDAPALSKHEICTNLVAVARANELPVGFFANLIWRESQFDHVAISRVGAMGIAQFMPDVADELGVDAFDARDALPASGRLLRELRARFGNLGLVAAAYNAGPKRVSDWLRQRSGLPTETRQYVNLITGRPVEQWRSVNTTAVVFKVPRQVPCHRSPEFSAIEQAERTAQLQKIAEEQKLLREKREAQAASKKKGRAVKTASRTRSS